MTGSCHLNVSAGGPSEAAGVGARWYLEALSCGDQVAQCAGAPGGRRPRQEWQPCPSLLLLMRTVTYLHGTGSQRLRGGVRGVPLLLWQSIREEQTLSGPVIKESESKLALRVGSELSQGNGGGHVGQEGPGCLGRCAKSEDRGL